MMKMKIPHIPGLESPLKLFGEQRHWTQTTCYDFRRLAGEGVDVNAVAEANMPYLDYAYHVPGQVLSYYGKDDDQPAAIVVELGEEFKASAVVDTFFEQIEHYQIRCVLARLPDVARRPVLVLLAPGENGLPVQATS